MNVVVCGAVGPVGALRGALPAAALGALGHKVVVLHEGLGFTPDEQRKMIRSADAVLILAPAGPFEARDPAFRDMRGALVVDVDDDFWAWEADPASGEADARRMEAEQRAGRLEPARLRELEGWLRGADLVTTTTEPLAAILRTKGARAVTVCRNALTPAWTRQTPMRRSIETTSALARSTKRHAALAEPPSRRIGWTGGIAHKADIRGAPLAAVARLSRMDPGVQLALLGPVNPAKLVEGWRVPTERWGLVKGTLRREKTGEVLQSAVALASITTTATEEQEKAFTPVVPFSHYYSVLEGCLNPDVAIVPMRESRFNASKSDVTLLSWAIKGVPVVCSKTGPYADALRAGFPALYVTHDDEQGWVDALRDLLYVRDRALDLARRAQRWVLECRCFKAPAGPDDPVHAWVRALEEAVDQHDIESEARAAVLAPEPNEGKASA